MKSEKAQSILEILVAMSISIPILAGITSVATNVAKSLIKIKSESSNLYAVSKIGTQISTLVDEVDQQRLNLPPRIHKNGKITYLNGKTNPISLRTDLLKPSILSDAITSISLFGIEALDVEKVDISGTLKIYYVCKKFSLIPTAVAVNSVNILSSETFIGLTTTGIIEFIGTATNWGSLTTKKCYVFSLTEIDGMISSVKPVDTTPFVHTIFPAQRLYTLYIDSGGRFRYLGHRGSLNIENQPILEGIDSLRLSYLLHPSPDFIGLKTTLRLISNNSDYRFSKISRLSRQNSLNILLN